MKNSRPKQSTMTTSDDRYICTANWSELISLLRGAIAFSYYNIWRGMGVGAFLLFCIGWSWDYVVIVNECYHTTTHQLPQVTHVKHSDIMGY